MKSKKPMPLRLALFQPDIALNVGTMIRLCACMGVPIDIIEPCGFPFSIAAIKRSGMDYIDSAQITRHRDWQAFNLDRVHRLILIETTGTTPYTDFQFHPDDILMVGRESAGTPVHVETACDHVLKIPMQPHMRSLNVAISAAMVLGEALRQVS